mgnify:CR=1 FL=1
MKIYFAGSIRGGRADKDIYYEIIELLKTHGTVLTEHVGNLDSGEDVPFEEIYQRDVEWLTGSDAIVAEITQPSLGVGYEIGKAEALGKPILTLYRSIPDRSVSPMIAGNSTFQTHSYTNVSELTHIFDDFFAALKNR